MWYSKLNVFILSLLCVFGIATQAEAAETYERTKTVYRSFGCNENSSVELTNQHGDIYINTWSEDSVAFSITIEAYSEKSEHLEDLLSMIEIEFNDYSSYIIAETQQAKNSTLLNKAAFGLSKLSGSREIRVNYQVYLPENIELSIENEFGDVYIGTHTSKFGNLRVDEISSSSGELNFKGTNTDYTLGFSAGVTGTFEIQMTGNKAFNSDKDYLNIQDTSQIDDKTTFYNGKINDSSSGIKLTLQSKNGEVNIGG